MTFVSLDGDTLEMSDAESPLTTYLSSLDGAGRDALATACGTSLGHLRNIAYGCKSCAPELAIEIERETGGKVRCEDLCPGVDWAYIRSTRRPRKSETRVG